MEDDSGTSLDYSGITVMVLSSPICLPDLGSAITGEGGQQLAFVGHL